MATNGWPVVAACGRRRFGWMLALVLVLLTRSLAGPPRPGAGVLVVTSPPVPLQQHPRKTRVAVNERARRVLGLEHARGAETGLEIVR